MLPRLGAILTSPDYPARRRQSPRRERHPSSRSRAADDLASCCGPYPCHAILPSHRCPVGGGLPSSRWRWRWRALTHGCAKLPKKREKKALLAKSMRGDKSRSTGRHFMLPTGKSLPTSNLGSRLGMIHWDYIQKEIRGRNPSLVTCRPGAPRGPRATTAERAGHRIRRVLSDPEPGQRTGDLCFARCFLGLSGRPSLVGHRSQQAHPTSRLLPARRQKGQARSAEQARGAVQIYPPASACKQTPAQAR